MAKGKTAERIVTDVREQREIASEILPQSKAVVEDFNYIHRDPLSGATAAVGQLDKRRLAESGRPVDYRYNQRLGMLRRRLRSTRSMPVTIINTLPVRLAVNSPLPALQVGVMGCELDQDYTYFTWMDPVIEVSVQEGQKIPLDYNPLMMAEEYLREYSRTGGVMIYEGSLPDFQEEITDPQSEAARMFRKIEEDGIVWMLGRVRQANDYWNTPNHQLSNNITELHRACAARCMAKNRIGNQKPQWMDVTRELNEVTPPCGSCGAIPERAAARCRQCGYVIDPIKAFMIRDIDEKNVALQRLTRAQVEELNISDFVAETADERPERLARGDDMPLSVFEQRVIARENAHLAAAQAVSGSNARTATGEQPQT
jgi:hypothetical protein